MFGKKTKWISTHALKTVAGILLFASATTGFAASGPWTTVAQIYTRTESGAPFIYFAPGAMPGCYNDRGGYLRLVDQANHDKTFSTLLSALIADREVQVFYDITGDASGWSMCQVTAIYVR